MGELVEYETLYDRLWAVAGGGQVGEGRCWSTNGGVGGSRSPTNRTSGEAPPTTTIGPGLFA